MIVSRNCILLALVAATLTIVNGKVAHVIKVGGTGRMIEPPFLIADLNDIVTFEFTEDSYSVTQSTFEDPLVPLVGGFNSGLVEGDAGGTRSRQTWELRITDVLNPIWFFCGKPQQTSNCTEKIVGSINPPNQTMYAVFISSVKQNSCPPATNPASSNSSVLVPTSTTGLSSIASFPPSISFANATPTQTSSISPVSDSGHRHRGAIIGGVIGAVFGLLLILLALFLYYRRRQHRPKASFGNTNSIPTRENKIVSNTFDSHPGTTIPPPSASSEKHFLSQTNADGPKTDIQDLPSLDHLGVQQTLDQPRPEPNHVLANIVTTPHPETVPKQQADVASGPSPENPDTTLFTDSSGTDPTQGSKPSNGPPIVMTSDFPDAPVLTEGHRANTSTISSSPLETHDSISIQEAIEIEEVFSPSTHRTPIGAQLRQTRRPEEAHPEYGTVIGIDLGTSYSRVGVHRGGTFEIIPNDQGLQATPSWVCFTGKGRLVGDFSQDFNPHNTVFSIKRLIGRKMDDLDVTKAFPFKVIGKNGVPTINIKVNGQERNLTPEEITATIITKMKEIAEAHLGHQVTHAVITVPACFNDAQRQATQDAGKIAGLDIVRMLNEPTAAAIAHGMNKKGISRVIVYSLGGGFFDVSLFSIDDGVFEVLATAGDTHLGGEDFDNRVVEHLIQLYKRRTGTDVSRNYLAIAKLKSGVEKAKRLLSSEQSTQIEISPFENGNDFSETLTRATFEDLNNDLFNKTIHLVEQVLRDAKCKKEEINEVVLIGGSTRIPKVQQLLKQYFRGKEPSNNIDPDYAIVRGAAIQGGILSGAEPDAGILLVDVCPHSLGIETLGEIFAMIIPRNTAIPTERSEIFTTVEDNQTTVTIAVYEGEHQSIKFNNLLGTFLLPGIPPAPKGVPHIKVTFKIDANAILQASAVDTSTGNSRSITIIANKGRLSQDEIIRMQKQRI